MTAPAECCSACRADPRAAPGRYCAPLRCLCGHPECPAYASWVWWQEQVALNERPEVQQRVLTSAAARLARRTQQMAEREKDRLHMEAWERRRARAGGSVRPIVPDR